MTNVEKAVAWAAKYDRLVNDVDAVSKRIDALAAWVAKRESARRT